MLALAHHMLIVVYNVLRRQEEYVELGADYYDQRNRPKVVSRLVKRLTALGYNVSLREASDGIGFPGAVADQLPIVDSPPMPEQHGVSVQSIGSAPDVHTATIPKRKRGRPCKCAERGIICPHEGPGGQIHELIELRDKEFS